ncbi:MAG: proline--tRNA ligase, partial [Rhodospirillaceae bacterium]|nr:proline--tRNA ligase [Rhodospirillaceae bacterium]
GSVWPEAGAPFRVGLINLRASDEACVVACEALYGRLNGAGIECLYDDSDDSAGAKFARMDLIGLPWQIVIGPRGVKAGTVELKDRKSGAREELSAESALARLAG